MVRVLFEPRGKLHNNDYQKDNLESERGLPDGLGVRGCRVGRCVSGHDGLTDFVLRSIGWFSDAGFSARIRQKRL